MVSDITKCERKHQDPYTAVSGLLSGMDSSFQGDSIQLEAAAGAADEIVSVQSRTVNLYHMGSCQNYGPFLGPYYNTAPII